ncbi:type 1 fimbrial protein [Citrobacter cronae]|uniref:fimbrial protein n=1 Tax=Citrobacter cronae TaxID=1748967 RepID=UPI0019026460|nr:type 1 fimbrial protein [Citrobacter cronae]MBJ8362575.1 type 1 fimbrial protein [Citrobacter cronae]
MYKIIILMLISSIFSLSVFAEEVTRINFGRVTPKIGTDVNVPFAESRVNIPVNCVENCNQSTIRWESKGDLFSNAVNAKKFIFLSGVPGIGIEVDLSEFNFRGSPVIIVRLIKLAVQYKTGDFTRSQPLIKWYLENKDGSPQKLLQSGTLKVDGSIYTGTCSPEQGDLYFNMKPVSVNLLKELSYGEKLHASSMIQNISINCSPGVADSFLIKFNGRYYNTSPDILDAGNGVGFIAEYKLTDKNVLWNGLGDFGGVIPETGKVEVPLKVYYTRTSEDIRAGNIAAKGQFTITYR